MRILVLVFTLIIMQGSSAGQDKVTKGAFGGVGLSAFKSGSGEGFLLRPTAGLFVNIPFVEDFGIRLEVLYSQRGEETPLRGTVMGYIDIPLLLNSRIKLSEAIGLDLRAFAGPQFGVLVSAEDRIGTTFTTDAYPGSSKSDFGILFGGGFAMDVGNGVMFLEGRFYLGTKELILQSFGSPMLMRSVSLVSGFQF